MSTKNNTIAQKTAELSELVAWFDSEDFTLESSLEKFKQAEKLATDIETDLAHMKNEILIVKKKFDSGV